MCVCARVIVWCDGSGERRWSACARGARWACGNVKNRGCVIGAMQIARLGCAFPALSRAQWLGCCTAVLRLRMCVVACALLHRVSLWLVCDGAALRGIVSAVDCPCVCVSLRCAHACVSAALQWGERCCVARVLWVAAAVAGRPCYALVRLVSYAVLHCCSVRADSDCSTVVEVLCVPPGVSALDAAAWCRGRVCDAAPPLCVPKWRQAC